LKWGSMGMKKEITIGNGVEFGEGPLTNDFIL
jgi:hypothetical protein